MVGIGGASQDGHYPELYCPCGSFYQLVKVLSVIDKNNQLGSIGECGSCDLRMGMRKNFDLVF